MDEFPNQKKRRQKRNSEKKWKGYAVTNDEVLVLLKDWRQADPDDQNKICARLISRLTYLVQSRIKRHRGQAFYDDLLQEGRIGLMKAVEDFNPTRGTNFFKFATWHIQTKVRRFLMKEIRRTEVLSDVVCIENSIPSPSLEEIVEQSEKKFVISGALGRLSERDRIVVTRRFGLSGDEPMTLQEIGDDLGVSRERVRQLESKALEKLKKNAEVYTFLGG